MLAFEETLQNRKQPNEQACMESKITCKKKKENDQHEQG